VATPHTGRFTTGRRSGNHSTVGWVGPRGGLNRCRKSRLPPPTRDSTTGPSSPKRVDILAALRGPTMIINTHTVTQARVSYRCLNVMRTPPPLLLLCAPSIKQQLTDVDRPRWWFAARRLYPLSRKAVSRAFSGQRSQLGRFGARSVSEVGFQLAVRLVHPILAPV
jgi:hypothetical protein